ncbi:hypothetical protein [Deinococcus soli (ex Cha et al. 2016)]|uniref:Uncharacterized protein n=1 Tax=Deinococcus soli (ex Cha et al. 2016) TaxID=1309411 RepID=A0ACC6KLX2_9DEIO|nr:hypothetical protein [Deinococcus soli (ex Cha et al. 2016)]MDR6753417.1 hypothetical protein [Deinococcus soli (ex Cha et al. 2016)]
MTAPLIASPVLTIGSVGIPRRHLPPEDAVSVEWAVSASEDALLSGFFAGQVSPAGATGATISIASPDGFYVPHGTGIGLEGIRPGMIITLTESYTRPDTQRTWVNCEVLTASVRAVATTPGRTGAWYSYTFTLRWRKQ